MTDEQLFAAGDITALVDRYRESLANYCDHFAPGDGDDIAQEVSMRFGEFPGGDRLFRPWLYGVAYDMANR